MTEHVLGNTFVKEHIADQLDDFLHMHRRRAVHFNVAPRYTPGSPAPVDMDTALRVASDEEGGYQHAHVGRYGAKYQEIAQKLGTLGIVEVRAETRKGWDVLDLLTGERFTRPFRS